MSFFKNLNFSSANEDSLSELAALSGAKRVLCLTGSGARALDMLLGDASEVIALDMNPAQNHLLHLKIAAFSHLEYDEMLEFIGAVPGAKRAATYAKIKAHMPADSVTFWDTHQRLVRRGLWYGGLWEKVLRLGARGNKILRGKSINALFIAPDIATQAEIWRTKFDDRIWRMSIRMLGQKWVWTRVIGEPGGAFLPKPRDVETQLCGAFNHAAKTFLFRESDFASLILRGRHEGPEALPLHMQPHHFDRIRDRVNRIQVVSGGLTDLERLNINEIDGFSLSDFGSYCDQGAYDACWRGVLFAAAPMAQYCERIFMNPLHVRAIDNPLFPPILGPVYDARNIAQFDPARIVPNPELSQHLSARDKAIIYQIRAGHIAEAAHDA